MNLNPTIRDAVLSHYRSMPAVTEGTTVGGCPAHLSASGGGYFWVICPCGSDGHYGYLTEVAEGLGTTTGEIITCFVHNLQFWYRPPSVADVIQGEESRFLAIMKSAGPKIEKERRKRPNIPPAEFAKYMHDTHGIPQDVTVDFLR